MTLPREVPYKTLSSDISWQRNELRHGVAMPVLWWSGTPPLAQCGRNTILVETVNPVAKPH